MSNNVTVTLGLKDQLTSPLRGVMGGVRRELGSVGNTSQMITSSIGGMTAGFIGMAASIATAGLALAGLKNGIKSAASLQTSMISTAGDVSNMVGTTYSTALASVKDIQKEIVKMAASLPGQTSGYAAIANSITASIALGSKGSLDQMKKDVIDVTKTLGLLAATKGVDMNMAASASTKFVNGSANLSELFAVNDVFQKNTPFRTYLQEQLKAIGKSESDWKTLDQGARNKVIVLAGKRAQTVEMLANFEGTAESLMETIKTNLFDEQIGIFGFLRPVAGLGGVATLDKVRNFLKSLINLSESFGKVGVTFDPMEAIGKGLDFLSDGLNSLSLALLKGDWSALKAIGKDLWKNVLNIPNSIKDGVNFAVKLFNKIDWNKVAEYGGQLIEAIGAGLSGVNWDGIGTGLGSVISAIASNPEVGNAVEYALKSALNGLATALFSGIKGIADKVQDWMASLDPKEVAKKALGKDGATPFERSFYDASKYILQGGVIGDASRNVNGFVDKLVRPEAQPLPTIQPQSNNSKTGVPVAYAPVINVTGVVGDQDSLAAQVMTAISNSFTTFQTNTIGA